MTLVHWLRFAHLMGVIVWVGGGVVLSLIGARAGKSKDPRLIGDFAAMLTYVGPRLLMPAVIVVLGAGLWLTFVEKGMFTQVWVQLGLAAFILTFLIGAVYLSRTALRLERVATGPDADPGAAAGVLARWVLGYRIVLVILVVTVWDMMFKPGP